MLLWAAKGMGSKRDLASSVWFLIEKMDVCGEKAANDEKKVEQEKNTIYLYILIYIGGTREDFAAVTEEAGFASEAQGIHGNRKQ